MAKKLGDFIVKVGEYQNRNGNNKTRWESPVALFQNTETGKFSISIKRTFNPAGVPCDPNSENIWLAFKPVEDKNNGNQSQGGYQSGRYQQGAYQGNRQQGNFDRPNNYQAQNGYQQGGSQQNQQMDFYNTMPPMEQGDDGDVPF